MIRGPAMRFVDQCRIKVIAGDGGNGAVAFRREKYVPFGGPAGGDGGRGGSVVFVGDEGLSTLLDFTHCRTIEGERGEHGQGKDCHGRSGRDKVERVPIGTQIRDAEAGELVADVVAHGQRVVVAQGGRGGRGYYRYGRYYHPGYGYLPYGYAKLPPGLRFLPPRRRLLAALLRLLAADRGWGW
jgi:Obg family GTPase CgtA